MTSRRQGGARIGAALLAVGVSHVAGWAVPVLVVLSEAQWVGGASGYRGADEVLLAVFLPAWLVGWIAVGSALAGHLVRERRGVRAGLLAAAAGAVAFVAAIAVSLLAAEALPAFRTPLAGIGVGVQLAVLLPGGGLLAAVRVALPVAVDLASAIAAGGTGVAGGLLAAPAWMALALVLVGVAEGVQGRARGAPACLARPG